MSIEINRKLEYDDRVALTQADQAIRKDVIRALVELITNSSDSYQRLEGSRKKISGELIIEVQRSHDNSVITIKDSAEGLDDKQMDKSVGMYGGATSGFKSGKSVRGLWGRGLKDAIFGLGHGDVFSVVDSTFHHCSLSIRNGRPTFIREKPVKATRAIRKQMDFGLENGTIVKITVSRPDVPVPQYDNIRRQLERHFELRNIMESPERRVILRGLDGRGRVKEENELHHKPPVGNLVLDETFKVPKIEGDVRLEVFRSELQLSPPSEEGDYADGGLLIVSGHVVLGLSLFKYENNEFASHFFGRVRCDYLHELLRKEPPEPVLTRNP